MSTKTLGKAKTAGSVPQEGKRISPLQKALRRDKYLLLMILPVIIWYLIFCYLPMAGLWMSFTDFVPGKGLAGLFTGKFVGLKWFRKFFESPYAFRLVRNTFLMAFYSLIFGFPIPIIFAICITQIKRKSLRQAGQVLTYLPYFISTVVVCGMINNFLSPSTGIINKIIDCASIVGMFMMGALSASIVKVATPLAWTFGDKTVELQATLDAIAPGLLPLSAVFFVFWGIKYKKWTITRCLIILIVASIIGAFLGVFAL